MNDPSTSGFRPGPTLRAGAVLAAFLLLFILIDRFSGPGGENQPTDTGAASGTTTSTQGATTTAAATTAATTTTTTTTTTPTTTTRAAGGTGSTTTRTTRLRSAEGVTVQILNGTGELRLARDFKPLVRQEGYVVVNTANTNGRYGISTVFFTDGHRADAEAFRARFPAFRIVDEAPASLSTTVALHVVIGENYRP